MPGLLPCAISSATAEPQNCQEGAAPAKLRFKRGFCLFLGTLGHFVRYDETVDEMIDSRELHLETVRLFVPVRLRGMRKPFSAGRPDA